MFALTCYTEFLYESYTWHYKSWSICRTLILCKDLHYELDVLKGLLSASVNYPINANQCQYLAGVLGFFLQDLLTFSTLKQRKKSWPYFNWKWQWNEFFFTEIQWKKNSFPISKCCLSCMLHELKMNNVYNIYIYSTRSKSSV